jgi:predicted dienelactone hydrolase
MGTSTRRQVLAQAGALLAAAVCSAARAANPESAVQDLTWFDSARQRQLPLRVRWPVAPGPWPVILYSHGLGGSRDGGDVWGSAWAAAGYVVMHLQHPGSDTAVLQAAGLGWMAALRAAGSAEQALARVADVRFVVDELTRRHKCQLRVGSDLWGQVRLDAIGMAGHSFGAQTAQVLAGQRAGSTLAAPADLADPRLRAFVALSPAGWYSPLPIVEQFAPVSRPFMVVTGSLDGDPLHAREGATDNGELRARVFDALPPGQRALLWLMGADHASFAGNGARRIRTSQLLRRQPLAQQLEDQHHATVARISTLWWAAHLLPSAATRAALAQTARAPELAPGDRFVLG